MKILHAFRLVFRKVRISQSMLVVNAIGSLVKPELCASQICLLIKGKHSFCQATFAFKACTDTELSGSVSCSGFPGRCWAQGTMMQQTVLMTGHTGDTTGPFPLPLLKVLGVNTLVEKSWCKLEAWLQRSMNILENSENRKLSYLMRPGLSQHTNVDT